MFVACDKLVSFHIFSISSFISFAQDCTSSGFIFHTKIHIEIFSLSVTILHYLRLVGAVSNFSPVCRALLRSAGPGDDESSVWIVLILFFRVEDHVA